MIAIVTKVTLSTNESTGLTTTTKHRPGNDDIFFLGSNAVHSRVLEGSERNFGKWKVNKNESILYRQKKRETG